MLVNFDTDQRKPWFIKAQRPDGSPLIFGYDVVDHHGHNVGIVGQGSQLFIRTNDIPPEVSVPVDKEQGFHVQSPLVKRLMKVKFIFVGSGEVVK